MRLSDTGVLGVSDLRNLNFVGSGMRRGPGELIFLAMPKHVLHNCKLNVRVCRLGCTLGSVVGLSPGVSVWILGGGIKVPKGLSSLSGTSNRGTWGVSWGFSSSQKGFSCSLIPFSTILIILLSLVHPACANRLVNLFSRKGWHIKLKDSSPGFILGFFLVTLFQRSPLSSTSISNIFVSYFSIGAAGRGTAIGLLGGGRGGGGRGPPINSPPSLKDSESWKFVLRSACSLGADIWST